MGRKKKETLELRYYEIPQGECILPLVGAKWRRVYGYDFTGLHFHNLMEIGYCLDGTGTLKFDTKEYSYGPGILTVIPQNYPHTTISTEGTNSYWSYLFVDSDHFLQEVYGEDPIFANKIIERINRDAHMVDVGDNDRMVRIVKALLEENQQDMEFRRQSERAYLQALLLEFARLNAQSNKRVIEKSGYGINQISDVFSYIEQNYKQPVKVVDLSRVCHMSETHFRRIFEEYVKMTPVEYINLVRVQKACEIMKKTHYSMDEVAQKVGYTTTSTFNRNFKAIVGTSPYQWKKNPENYEGKLLNFNVSVLKGW